jgi:hypothetical protein
MTKVSIFGQQPTETKELKKIEFVKWLSLESDLEKAKVVPSNYENVMLLEKNYPIGYDLILAWDEVSNKTLYLGHWNDGVV